MDVIKNEALFYFIKPRDTISRQRRIAEGKHVMGTLNIIRNKILARIFAVAKRGTPYVDTYGYAS